MVLTGAISQIYVGSVFDHELTNVRTFTKPRQKMQRRIATSFDTIVRIRFMLHEDFRVLDFETGCIA
jgi:hypothetical protein